MQDKLPRLDAAGLARFRALRAEAVEAATRRCREQPGALYARYGQAGEDACREDLAFHLEFLQPALEFGSLQPMVDYLRWLGSVLAARDLPLEHVALSLDWLAEFFAARLEAGEARIVNGALAAARARFLELGPAPDAAQSMAPEAWPECAAYTAHLLAGNQRGALEIIDRALQDGHKLVEAEMHIVQPAMYDIGRKWQANQVSVAQEHLATAIARTTMVRGLVKSDPAAPNGRKVLLACVQGNDHAIGLQMVADAFQLGGWDVQYLGANVPTDALLAQVAQWQPDLIGLSVSFAHQLPTAKDLVARLERAHGAARPRIMVGGLAINSFDELTRLVGADAWSPDAASALANGERLLGLRNAA